MSYLRWSPQHSFRVVGKDPDGASAAVRPGGGDGLGLRHELLADSNTPKLKSAASTADFGLSSHAGALASLGSGSPQLSPEPEGRAVFDLPLALACDNANQKEVQDR